SRRHPGPPAGTRRAATGQPRAGACVGAGHAGDGRSTMLPLRAWYPSRRLGAAARFPAWRRVWAGRPWLLFCDTGCSSGPDPIQSRFWLRPFGASRAFFDPLSMATTQNIRRLVLGNWKMHGSLTANAQLLSAVRSAWNQASGAAARDVGV